MWGFFLTRDPAKTMRQCVHCKEFKEEDEFAFNNRLLGIRQKHCRSCMSEFNKRSYAHKGEEGKAKNLENRRKRMEVAKKYIWDYLSNHPCIDCGETDPIVLEFDHVLGTKKLAVTQMATDGYAIEPIKEEISKCVVRCRNCHWRRHHREGDWFKG